jgi:hypothetical protein
MSQGQNYDIPDEHLSYSELRDRIRLECARALPKKERILLMAKKLEDDLTIKDTICDQICTDLKDVTSEQHIRRSLPDEYKQVKKRRITEESTSGLRAMFANDNKNVPEQTTMTVEAEGREEPFDRKRPNVESASELVNKLQREIEAVRKERDSLSVENEVLKEKTQPEMLREISEKFSDDHGLIKGDKLQKVNEEAGKNLVRMLERYNSILNDAVKKGEPVPVGLYVIARPETVLVPVRFTVDFRLKRMDISLWEKKLQSSYSKQ